MLPTFVVIGLVVGVLIGADTFQLALGLILAAVLVGALH